MTLSYFSYFTCIPGALNEAAATTFLHFLISKHALSSRWKQPSWRWFEQLSWPRPAVHRLLNDTTAMPLRPSGMRAAAIYARIFWASRPGNTSLRSVLTLAF
jgi:hypothetical protein